MKHIASFQIQLTAQVSERLAKDLTTHPETLTLCLTGSLKKEHRPIEMVQNLGLLTTHLVLQSHLTTWRQTKKQEAPCEVVR